MSARCAQTCNFHSSALRGRWLPIDSLHQGRSYSPEFFSARLFCGIAHFRRLYAPDVRLVLCVFPVRRPRLCRRAPRPQIEEHTSELQSHLNLVCRLLLEKKKKKTQKRSLNSSS